VARFRKVLDSPRGRTVINYGLDPAIGFFCRVTTSRAVLLDYDNLRAGYDALPGLLRGLVTARIVDQDDVDEATRVLPHIEDVGTIADEHVRLVAIIIIDLRRAAGE